MSVKMMGLVWDAKIPREEKLVLLAYADHADHDGNDIYPSYDTIARKTGYDRRSAIRITNSLKESRSPKGPYQERNNLLIPAGRSHLETNKFKLNISELITLSHTPTDGGDILSPPHKQGVTKFHQGGDKSSKGGDTMSPEPSFKTSLNHDEKILNQIKEQIKSETPLATYNQYVKPIFFFEQQNGSIKLGTSDDLHRDWLAQSMTDIFRNHYKGILDKPDIQISFITAPKPEGARP